MGILRVRDLWWEALLAVLHRKLLPDEAALLADRVVDLAIERELVSPADAARWQADKQAHRR